MKSTLGAGRLRHRIEITRKTLVPKARGGGFDTAWTPIASPYAQIEGLNGRESMLAGAMQGISSYRLTIRWLAGIKQSDQVKLPDGTLLNVRAADDEDGRRRWLIIMADTGSVEKEA